ncbi:hypothetical protein BV25DRAFT_1917388 [Artomyces pyxidatus]|uniref:Uncharacterized protein n=1 Tax=Artomyces pyxidatus TaxID=48021 RepID=A0ACB8SYA8_9AGAM|nr:hypothetical protein BV25DRAFT_1917388 [Artomyces pyxidatus]
MSERVISLSSVTVSYWIICSHLDLIGVTEHELEGSVVTMQCQDLLTRLFRCSDLVKDAVLAQLALCPDDAAASGLLKRSRWPKSGGERAYYRPFSKYMTIVLDAIRKSTSTSAFHRNLAIHVNDAELRPGIDNARPLKPDHIGCHMASKPDLWFDVHVVGDAKNTRAPLLRQLTTYARARFASGHDRWFVVGILLDHSQTSCSVAIFHRGGVIMSPYLRLSSQSGAQDFISLLLGIMSWKNATEAGLDITRFTSPDGLDQRVSLPVLGECQVLGEPLYERNTVRGRATLVQRVQRLGTSTPPPASSTGSASPTNLVPSIAPGDSPPPRAGPSVFP